MVTFFKWLDCVAGDQFSTDYTVSLWRQILVLFLAVVILASSRLHSSVISVVESECHGERNENDEV